MFVKKIPGHMVINRVIVVRNSKSCLVKSDLGKSLDIVFKGVRPDLVIARMIGQLTLFWFKVQPLVEKAEKKH